MLLTNQYFLDYFRSQIHWALIQKNMKALITLFMKTGFLKLWAVCENDNKKQDKKKWKNILKGE